MMMREEEKSKVNSSQIRSLEKKVDRIDEEIQLLADEFDLNINRILGNDLIVEINKYYGVDIKNKMPKRVVNTNYGKIEVEHSGFLLNFHKSLITDPEVKEKYERKLIEWFSSKTLELKKNLNGKNTYKEVNKYVFKAYALASLAITSFHKFPDMKLRDVQTIAALAINDGDIAELGTGEGKTLSAVLPAYLHALRGKGVHIITANSYLSKRDYEEIKPIFNGLGISCGFVPDNIYDLAKSEGKIIENLSNEEKDKLEKELTRIKKDAYISDVTYGSKSAIAFDYLRDGTVLKKEDLLQRHENPGLAIIDEVDDVLIDDAQCPYILANHLPVYHDNMNLFNLSTVLGIPYSVVKSKVEECGMDIDSSQSLDFETARTISYELFFKEIIPDQLTYQKRAQRFFESKILPNIYIVKEKNEFGVSPSRLYEILTAKDDEYEFSSYVKNIRDKSLIIYYPETKQYHVMDRCYDDFLIYCYAAFRINSLVENNQSSILNDSNYFLGLDYNIVNGKVKLTLKGINRIIHDNNHIEFVNDYNSYMNFVAPMSNELLHYLDQAIIANLKMKSPADYVVENGAVKLVKNGRIQEGTTYAEGLQQAIELKEKIPLENISRENQTIASITQKDFFSRYDVFSGMTGTSAKKIFERVFGKNTVSIPRDAFYKFYSHRLIKKKKNSIYEPIGVEKRETKFAIDINDKVELIVQSIKKSQSMNPKQPVLLVVADPLEIKILSTALNKAGINHSLLDTSVDKSKEAEIIAKAGLPGSVTISTEMAGRGTDIKIGGDRETIIDIATERHIKVVEEKFKKIINLSSSERDMVRENVEKALMNYKTVNNGRILWSTDEEKTFRSELERVGLKVISSGFFFTNRIDKQLEGRTGRNGISGVCERYACPKDLEYIGVKEIQPSITVAEYFSRYGKNIDRSLSIPPKDFHKINDKVRNIQLNNEEIICMDILETQQLDKTATDIMGKYREERIKIIVGEVDIDLRIQKMLEDTVDNLLLSYITSGVTNRENLLSDLSSGQLKIDFEAFALEAKDVLGIDIDTSSLTNSNANLLEFRNALLDYLIVTYDERKKTNLNEQAEKEKTALLVANDYVISNINSVLSTTTAQKRLNDMTPGMNQNSDNYANVDFYDNYQKLTLEASKIAIKRLIGGTLSIEERKKMEKNKEDIFGIKISQIEHSDKFDVSEPTNKENNRNLINRFREIKKQIEDEARMVAERPSYQNLVIMPMTLKKILPNSEKLVLTRDSFFRIEDKVSVPVKKH